MGLTRELAATVGPRGASASTPSRPGFFHSRMADAAIEKVEPQHQGDQSDSPCRPCRRTERRGRFSRGRRVQLHHRTESSLSTAVGRSR